MQRLDIIMGSTIDGLMLSEGLATSKAKNDLTVSKQDLKACLK